MNKFRVFALSCIFFLAIFAFVSCVSPPVRQPRIVSPVIFTGGVKNAEQLYSFFLSQNPGIQASRAQRLAGLYVDECALEGINSDVAFVQMCLETGFLRFGNLVTADMNNFCGLGAINAENPGLRFETEQLGIRAHVQHLKAYGTAEPLNMPLVDPRYKYVTPKGKAADVSGLAGTWAADPRYGEKLLTLLEKLNEF